MRNARRVVLLSAPAPLAQTERSMPQHIFDLDPDDDFDPDAFAEDLDSICWSCRSEVDEETTVSLGSHDGRDCIFVCPSCWEQIPVAERIRLQWMVRRRPARKPA